MPQVLGTYAEATVEQSLGAKNMVNVWHFRFDDAGGELSLAQATTINGWLDDFYTDLATFYPDAWQVDRVVVRDWNTATGPAYEFFTGLPSGTNVNSLMPTNLAVVMTKRTGLSGRSFRGRTYLGPFTEADNTADGFVSDELDAAITAAGADLLTASAATFELAVVSQVTGGAQRPSAVVTDVTQVVVDNKWDHQDRRKF
jgi:hypothetical protein